ncbi:AAA family ATPase [Methylosinus sp. H3A]|uniref:YhaN family protein n=1 Tax=Methylosinus sp. H3A TaxID=2785786 RepID=UPI0018C31E37|nr:YhaN family protein [Methylosinus sp. H3A]MBG0808097.1 AAA family ATPase [Methylosinus sp. H3A]
MRLRRLNLARYGKFTDFPFDFGALEPGKPDFHVIFGPNEAGKSTTLFAILDLLFGIEHNTRYGHLHGFDNMEISAEVEFASGLREFRRRKKRSNSLLDAYGNPLPETAILDEMGGLSREDYRFMFSLDEAMLAKGGEAILANKGDLGQLLFSASAGLADLSQNLNAMRGVTEAFFKEGGRKHELASLKDSLKDLAEKREECDTQATVYAKLVAESKCAEENYRKALEDRTQAQRDKEAIEAIEIALPRIVKFEELSQKIAELGELPDAAPELKDTASKLRDEAIRLETELAGAVARVADLEREIEAIVADETILKEGETFAKLDKPRSRSLTALEDLPNRKLEKDRLSAKIKTALRDIGRDENDDARELLLDARTKVRLTELGGAWGALDTAQKTAKREQAQAVEKEHKARERRTSARVVDSGNGLRLLSGVVHDVREGGFDTKVSEARKKAHKLKSELAGAMAPLGPWSGCAEDLRSLRVPGPTAIAQWASDVSTAEKASKDTESAVQTLSFDIERLIAERDCASAGFGVMSDSEAAVRRGDREKAWAEHRRRLDSETADAFEEALRADDLVISARINHANEVAKVNVAVAAIILKEAEQKTAIVGRDKAKGEEAALRKKIADAITMISEHFPESMDVAAFEAWIERYETATRALNALLNGESELRGFELDLSEALSRLRNALARVGVAFAEGDDLKTLLQLGQNALDAEMTLKGLDESLTTAQEDLKQRDKDLSDAQKAVDQWRADWKEACESCWIGQTHPDAATTLVSAIVEKLKTLEGDVSAHKDLDYRIEAMTKDLENFEKEVREIAARIGVGVDGRSSLALFDVLKARIEVEETKARDRDAKSQDLDQEREKVRKFHDSSDQNVTRQHEILSLLGVETLDAALVVLARIATRANYRESMAFEEKEVLGRLKVDSMVEASVKARESDLAEMASLRIDAQNRFDEADGRMRTSFAQKAKLDSVIETVGGDDAVARIEEQRRTICLEIEDKSLRWFRLRAGVVAAERALRIYRDKHRSSMLASASAAFSTISRGMYEGLSTIVDGAKEQLVGVVADTKGTRNSEEMSTGTRFQLFLALRVAGYLEFARTRQSGALVPFVADDILETFDDGRSEEAFRLLLQMAQFGQVIYLTHHEHLCAIAQAVCPDVRLHRFD